MDIHRPRTIYFTNKDILRKLADIEVESLMKIAPGK